MIASFLVFDTGWLLCLKVMYTKELAVGRELGTTTATDVFSGLS